MLLLDDEPARSGSPSGALEPSAKRPKHNSGADSDQDDFWLEKVEIGENGAEMVEMPVTLGGYKTTAEGRVDEIDAENQVLPSLRGESDAESDAELDAGLDSSSGSLDLDLISEAEFRQIIAETPDESSIEETRVFLKTFGPVEFLQKYLPTTATSRNILEVIVRLGFVPRDVAIDGTGDQISGLIRLLNQAMKSVLTTRTRLDHFYSLDHVLEKLQSAKKVLVLSGAGISTSLGIPDFRSSQGFYAKLQHLGLSDPQDVFDLGIFHSDPTVFYLIAHMILPPEHSFTPMHAFIKALDDRGILLRNYTQNIDNLESNVGLSSERVVQCHGSFATATCVTCKNTVPGHEIFDCIRNKEVAYCPKCTKARLALMDKDEYVPESYGVMKPDITFFGEPLPAKFHDIINEDLQECDVVVSVGTSLKVAPVADIVDKVPPSVPQILINRDPITHCNFDVSLLGYCDDVAELLERKLGWKTEGEDKVRVVEVEKRMYKIGRLAEEPEESEESAEDSAKPESAAPESLPPDSAAP
jgi:NAD-dependent histone deacetylase SIR2